MPRKRAAAVPTAADVIGALEGAAEAGASDFELARGDALIARYKREKEFAERKYRELQRALHEAEDRADKIAHLRGALESARRPEPIRVASSGRPGESVAVVALGDWHLEETVDPSTVENVNRYDLDIAERRARAVFVNALKLVEMCRSKSRIDTLVLAVLGDMITGYIHEELVEGNGCSPVQACVRVNRLLREGINLLLREGGFRQIIVPCNYGNHGRTTQKPRVSTGARNSYEWMTYQFVAEGFAANARVRFLIADGYFNYLPIYGFTYRFHHGDGIRYQGGVGDVDVPLNKAIAQWNKFKPAHCDVLGHWHTRKTARHFGINGSLIGFNAYSIRIKASYEPPMQSFFLVHPERGRTVEAPIFVE